MCGVEFLFPIIVDESNFWFLCRSVFPVNAIQLSDINPYVQHSSELGSALSFLDVHR